MLLSTFSCTMMGPSSGPTVPRPDQQVWLNEVAVINLVTRLVYDSNFASRRKLAEERYAALLRYWYKRCSLAGEDLDGGKRALNFIRKIHFDAGGDRKLWDQVVEMAKKPAPMQNGLAIPPDTH